MTTPITSRRSILFLFRKRNSPHHSKLSLTSIRFAHNTQPLMILLFPLAVPPVHVILPNIFKIISSQRLQKKSSPPPPYHLAGGTDVDISDHNEVVMAMVTHYIMTHTATSLSLAAQGQLTKKQYDLKAGLRRFGL